MNQEHGLLERVVLGDQFKEHIMEAILNGEYKPGDRRVASAVARRHEVLLEALASRNPQKAGRTMRRHIKDLSRPPEGYSGSPASLDK